MKSAQCVSVPWANPFSRTQSDRQFIAICSYHLIVSHNHKDGRVIYIYNNDEIDGPTILTIPLMETANEITL